MQKRTAFLILVMFSVACNSSVRHPAPHKNSPAVQDPELLCRRVAEIKTIPFKDENVDDAAYNALLAAGEQVVPCLIELVTDTTPMRDPRGIPGPADPRVGNVAFFVVRDIAKLDFESMMPPDVKRKFKTEGVYAYHFFVAEDENRKRLQATLRDWYRQKYGFFPPQTNKR